MIPVSLTLRNFLSYGEDAPTLDFSQFQIACVTGRNGHGKSALFDAITWALWGEARKASSDRKPDEGLLRIGSTDLRVEFVFDLDRQRFRVARSFRKTSRSGSSRLELQVLDEATNRYRALSESGSIRKTQARLNKLVRMGYDTFVNSAFILQGRVDEFTRRSPTDRKAILADILELSRYDSLAARARDHARRAETEVIRGQDRITQISEAAVRQVGLRKQLIESRQALVIAECASAESQKNHDACSRQIAKVEAQEAQKTAVLAERDGLLLRHSKLISELESAERAADFFREAVAAKDRILADVETLSRLRKTEESLRSAQSATQDMQLSRTRLNAELEAARLKVETRQQHWSGIVTDLRAQIEQGEKALSRRPEVRETLKKLVDLRRQDTELIALRDQRDRIEKRRRVLETDFNARRSEIQVDIETCRAKRRDLQMLLDRRTGLEQAFNDARQHLATFQALNDEMERVKREGTESQQSEERLKERIEGLGRRRQQLVAQTEQLRDHDDPDCPLCGSNLDKNHRAEVLDELAREIENLSWEHDAATGSLADARNRTDACRSAYQKLRDQVHPLGDAPRTFAQAETELSQVSGVDGDLARLVGRIQSLEDRAKTFESISDTAIELREVRTQISGFVEQTSHHEKIRERLEKLSPAELEDARLDEIQTRVEAARKQLPEALKKSETATEWLDAKRYAPEIQTELIEITDAISKIGYDSRAHKQTREQIESLQNTEQALVELHKAERELAVVRTRIEATTARRSEIESDLKGCEALLLKLKDIDQDRADLEDQLARLTAQLKSQRTARDAALREVAAIERDDGACQALIEQKQKTATELANHEREATIHRELVRAFGRDGIQALLIDQAIPELQDEANRILSRLTANGTQVTLESLGELKGGGTKETLDIRISDELGERRYELYSGGEAFRVDFAIRIALSKLLAHRAGTPLQTLVIDEGFGTQDEQGLSHLIEAIQMISDEFEKVLVITHIETIKNAFPVRIEVVKHADAGSTFNVVS